MDSKQLIGYMTRPETLKDGAVKEMEQLVADYPYFAIGQTRDERRAVSYHLDSIRAD